MCVRMPVSVYDTYVNDCKRIRCTNLFVCLYAHLYIHVYYIHFLQKVLESIPTLSKVAASLVFFSPRQASSLHRPGAISTHASPPRRLWLQPTIWLQLPGRKDVRKVSQNWRICFFFEGGGEGKQKRTKILPESLAVPNRFSSIFSLCCFML